MTVTNHSTVLLDFRDKYIPQHSSLLSVAKADQIDALEPLPVLS